jgi:hypothetical protein
MPAPLTFPFWLISQRHGSVSVPVSAPGTPGFIVAFSSAAAAAEFMESHGETAWELKLVSRHGYDALADDLRAAGVVGICLNPDSSAMWVGLGDAPGTLPHAKL